jgi:hypothetical protein
MIATPRDNQPVDETAKPADLAPKMDVKPKGRRRISVSVVNFWIDASLLLALSILDWVSATLQIVFPAPTRAGGWTLWGLTFDQWRDVQFGTLCLFALGILVHVMMHWNWICSLIATQIIRARQRPDEGMQTIYGVITLIVLLHLIAAGVIAAMLFVRRPPSDSSDAAGSFRAHLYGDLPLATMAHKKPRYAELTYQGQPEPGPSYPP